MSDNEKQEQKEKENPRKPGRIKETGEPKQRQRVREGESDLR